MQTTNRRKKPALLSIDSNPSPRPRSILAALILAVGTLCLACAMPAGASAAVSCPNSNPVVNENNCMGAGSSAWQISNGRTYDLAGFASQTSYNLGQGVPLKIGAYAHSVDISVFRMGYYGGKGGRLVASASDVPVNNGLECEPMKAKTGEVNCDNWETTYTIPGSSLPASGVYLVKLVDPEGDDNQIIFIVRNDNASPSSEIIAKIPTSTYQAYNWFGGKSLYNFNSSLPNLADGAPRAFSVSFQRPFQDIASGSDENWFLKVDYPMVYWLEKEGYNVSYTDGVAIDEKPESLLTHKVVLISGHDEYWSGKELTAMKAAREHGVSIASFSGNTAYWKVQYENNHQTMTTYKTVQDGSEGVNDPGPEAPTTTFRDPGAPAGSPNAPPGGRPGPNTPENSLFGVMYVGDTTNNSSYGLTVPPAEGQDQYSGDSIWRNTGINPATGATIGTNLVGWEWDAIPSQPGFLAFEPANVVQVSRTNVNLPGTEWLLDYGMEFGPSPPPGQNGFSEAVKYRAASGAIVFASGTMQWSWGLGPHFLNKPEDDYTEPPVESSDPRIQQATYNILSEMGVQPQTPTGIVLDGGEGPPTAAFGVSPTVVTAGQSVTLNGSGSYAVNGASITDYKWDLDGSGKYATDDGSTPTLTHVFETPGTVTVGLKVTDSNGHTATTTRTITVGAAVSGAYAHAVLETPGLSHYWRLDEATGSAFSDLAGGDTATIAGGLGSVTLGQPGAITANNDTAASFDGISGTAQAPVNLSETSKVTVEFWLKWNKYENNDALAMEFTSNFNNEPGGFLVDPNASDLGGTFAVGIGKGSTRNNVFFARPSAGVWHYYAFVLDTTAAGASEITPYVDGQKVSYTKIESGTGSGTFANSTLNFMSRGGTSLFGAGTLDEVALYSQTLGPETILAHYQLGSGNSGSPTPTAAFTNSPTTARINQPVSFDGSSSTDPDGTITDYKWDLDGSGTYATDTGSTPTVSHTFTTPGPVKIGLKVTDSNGQTSTVTHTIEVQGPTTYAQAIEETPGIAHYWRLDEPSGSSFADLVGGSAATIAGQPGAVTLGLPGALSSESDAAASFDGLSGTAQAPVNLSATNKLTIEFWLKWNKYENNDALAMEFTSNFNNEPGGFLVDPNAGEEGGEFAVGIGQGGSRNNVYFARPSTGTWHYYAFVINTLAPAASEITPYVDGQPVPYTKLTSGSGAGTFANSTLNFMSRATTSLFGAGTLDEVALYNETLTPTTVLNHYQLGSGTTNNPPPTAAFTATPSTVSAGQSVTLNGSGSLAAGSATITDYKWDLDGSGKYATDTGSTPTLSHAFGAPGTVTVGLKVTDSNGQSSTVTHTIVVGGSVSTPYAQTVLATPGISHYWRLGEQSGSTLVDAAGGASATTSGGAGAVTLGAPGALSGESDTAASFDGLSGTAQAPVNLSSTSKLTIEFWLNWAKYENNDALAMELTPNFNTNPGGFLVDPNASEEGEFAVGIGQGGSRNNVYFARPSAGTWHYYAFVINTTAAGESEITPYVDGQPVPYTKLASGTGAGTFANSTLNFMSRGGTSLFGAGTLDEVALYNETLTPAAVLNHYQTGIGIDTTPPSGGALTVNGTAASAAGSSSSNTSGSITLARTDYSEAQIGNQSGLASSTLTVVSAPLEGGVCGTFGSSPTTIEGSATQTVSNGCYRYTLTGVDKAGNAASISSTVKVDTTPPSVPTLSFGALSAATYYKASNNTLYFNPTHTGGFTVVASATDINSGIAGYAFSSLTSNGFTETQTGGQNVYAFGVSATAPQSPPTVTATNGVGATAKTTYNLVADSSAPTGGALTVNGVAASAAGSSSFNKTGGFTIGTRTEYTTDAGSGLASSVLTRAIAPLANNTCGTYGTPVTITGNPAQSGLADDCYLYKLTGTDNVGNTASLSETVKVDATAPAPTLSVPADANGAVAVTFAATDAGSGVSAASGQLKRATATYTATTDTCGAYGAFANIGSAGPTSPFSDTTVSTGHCYEYEYTVSDAAGNSATSAVHAVKVNTTKPALTGIVDTTSGSTAGLAQVGDAVTLQFNDPIAAASIPASVTLTYARSGLTATTVTVSGLGSGSWSSGDSLLSRYTNTGGTSPVVTATTLVSGTTVKLTVSAITDPSKNLTAGGPGTVSGTVNAAVKDVFGNTASTSSFTTGSVRLF